MTNAEIRAAKAVGMLKDFLEESSRFGARRWIGDAALSVYVRKGMHLDDKRELKSTLDIANVVAVPQSTGAFTSFLKQAETISPLPIFIENVTEERFGRFFETRGYLLIPRTNPPCFILHK